MLGARFDYHLVKPARIDALQSPVDSIQVGKGASFQDFGFKTPRLERSFGELCTGTGTFNGARGRAYASAPLRRASAFGSPLPRPSKARAT